MAEENLKIGSGLIPVFVDKHGKVVPTTNTLGSGTKPIYLNNGTLTASNSNSGSDTKPLKMVNGSLVPVSSDLATQAWVNTHLSSGYVDFRTWTRTTLSLTGDAGSYILTIPNDGYLTATTVSNYPQDAYIDVLDKNDNWIIVDRCVGTDFWDNINRYSHLNFRGFVRKGNKFRFRIRENDKASLYLWTPPA